MATKTPVTVLQELMVKHNTLPQFDFLDSDTAGVFQCRVKALDVSAIGKSRSKKEAKHEAARVALEKLAEAGKYFPNASHDLTPSSQKSPEGTDVLVNYVGALKDLCCELCMPHPEYNCIGETGLSHSKQFTIMCTTASLERTATACSKKQAKQLAAEKIFIFLNENMHKRIAEAAEQENLNTKVFSELNEIAVIKYLEKTDALWKPSLGQRINDYHLGLLSSIEKDLLDKALIRLNSPVHSDPVILLEEVLQILDLEFDWSSIEGQLCQYALLKIPHVNPPIFITVPCDNPTTGKLNTAKEALDYLKLVFSY